jgi:hypothetical protein
MANGLSRVSSRSSQVPKAGLVGRHGGGARRPPPLPTGQPKGAAGVSRMAASERTPAPATAAQLRWSGLGHLGVSLPARGRTACSQPRRPGLAPAGSRCSSPCPLAGHRAQCAPAAHVRGCESPVFPRRGGKPSGRPLVAAVPLAATSPSSQAPGRQAAPLAAACQASAAPAGPWCALSECAPRLEAPSGSGAQGRERRAALSSVALSPRGVQGVGPARRLARPTRQAAPLSPACQRSADEASRWVAIPALRGCQPIAEES